MKKRSRNRRIVVVSLSCAFVGTRRRSFLTVPEVVAGCHRDDIIIIIIIRRRRLLRHILLLCYSIEAYATGSYTENIRAVAVTKGKQKQNRRATNNNNNNNEITRTEAICHVVVVNVCTYVQYYTTEDRGRHSSYGANVTC